MFETKHNFKVVFEVTSGFFSNRGSFFMTESQFREPAYGLGL